MKSETLLTFAFLYVVTGVAVAGYTVHLAEKGRPHFTGQAGSSQTAAYYQAVFLWPMALYHDVKRVG